MANPNTAWPPPTDPRYIPVFRFDCTVVGAKSNYQAFTIEYLDYSGENFIQTNLDPATLEAFEGHLASADVLLGLLDGQKVMKLLDGDISESITYETTHLAPILQQLVRHRVPVHFVLTKWDLLLDAYGGSEADLLARVQERLMALRQFADAVDLRRRYSQGAMRRWRKITVPEAPVRCPCEAAAHLRQVMPEGRRGPATPSPPRCQRADLPENGRMYHRTGCAIRGWVSGSWLGR